jgi:hypothetical protein
MLPDELALEISGILIPCAHAPIHMKSRWNMVKILMIFTDLVFKMHSIDFLECKYIIFILSKTINYLNLHDCALLYSYEKNRLFVVNNDAFAHYRM